MLFQKIEKTIQLKMETEKLKSRKINETFIVYYTQEALSVYMFL